MPSGPFSLCLQAHSFMPTGPLFYAYGPSSFVTALHAVLSILLMICYPCFPEIQLDILVPSKIPYFWTCQASLARAFSPRLRTFCRNSSCPLPRPVVSFLLPALQAVVVKEAPPGSLDSTFEYWLEAEEIPEVNAVIAVDACTQYSQPSSRPEFCSDISLFAHWSPN